MRIRAFIGAAAAALAFSGVAAGATTDPQQQISQADMAYAQSVALTGADVGAAWKDETAAAAGDTTGPDPCPNFAPDESDLVVTGDGGSFFLRRDGASILSSATTWASAANAQADFDRTNQPGLLDCFAKGVTSGSTKKVKIVFVSRGPLAIAAGTFRAAAYRLRFLVKTTVKVKKKTRTLSVPLTSDLVLFGNDRVNALLVMTALQTKPLTGPFEAGLVKTMAARMTTVPAPTTP